MELNTNLKKYKNLKTDHKRIVMIAFVTNYLRFILYSVFKFPLNCTPLMILERKNVLNVKLYLFKSIRKILLY